MFTESTLRKLLDFSTTDPVISLYLNTEPSLGNAEAHRLRLRNMLKEIHLDKDVEAIIRFFDHSYDWAGRGVAVFSCTPAGLFQHIPLAVPVKDQVIVSTQPAVKPLVNLMDNFGGYGIVLVDKQNARFFYFHLGEIVESQTVSGEAIKQFKSGSSSSLHGQRGGDIESSRAVQETIDRNMRDTVEHAAKFFEEKHIRRIMIGGSDENVSQFKSMLPKAWLSLVVGTFTISMNASTHEIMEKTMEVAQQAEKQEETALVEKLITAAAKQEAAVAGLESTLSAVTDSRVQTLVIRDGLTEPGYYCSNCGLLTSQAIKKHHACPEPAVKVDDVIHLAVNSVLRNGGAIEVLHAGSGLESAEGIGAYLRY